MWNFKNKRKQPVNVKSFIHSCDYIANVLEGQVHPIWSLRGVFKDKDSELDSIASDVCNLSARLRELIRACKEMAPSEGEYM